MALITDTALRSPLWQRLLQLTVDPRIDAQAIPGLLFCFSQGSTREGCLSWLFLSRLKNVILTILDCTCDVQALGKAKSAMFMTRSPSSDDAVMMHKLACPGRAGIRSLAPAVFPNMHKHHKSSRNTFSVGLHAERLVLQDSYSSNFVPQIARGKLGNPAKYGLPRNRAVVCPSQDLHQQLAGFFRPAWSSPQHSSRKREIRNSFAPL